MSSPTAADVRLASVLRDEAIPALPVGPDTGSILSALRAAHSRSGSRPDLETPGLQSAICEYVARARSEGYLVEHAIVRLKRAMADVGLSADGGPRAAINSDVITRCIHEYYRQ